MVDRQKDIRLFERAAMQRLAAASFLLEHGYNLDATYLAGYAVECSLKALILKGTSDKEHLLMMQKLTAVGSLGHNFEYLKGLLKAQRGRRGVRDREFFGKLTEPFYRVASWSTDIRYQVGRLDQEEAESFVKAAQDIHKWCLRS